MSFVGGSTDFPWWFKDHGGAVISASINKFCYLTLRELPPFFQYRSRFIWSRVEDVNITDEIAHPAIKACLQYFNIKQPRFAFHHDADVPAQSGLGSSAAFTVGLLKALYSLQGRLVTARQLALDAIRVDQDYAHDVCGIQDQCASAFGGLNLIRFHAQKVSQNDTLRSDIRENFTVEPLAVDLHNLANHLMLFYTGQQRTAADVERAKLKQDNTKLLLEQASLTDPCLQALQAGDMALLGRVLSRSWQLKRAMAAEVSNPAIDGYIERALNAGALGAKLCGAGSGGSLLVCAHPAVQPAIRVALADLVYIPFRIDTQGSQLIYYDGGQRESEERWQATA